MSYLIQLGGLLVLIAVASLLFITILATWRRLVEQRKKFELETEILKQRLQVARRISQTHEALVHSWSGIRKFQVSKREEESSDVCSFYLVSHDKKAIPSYKPGQYLTFELNIPGENKKTVRCYSLSDSYRPDHYRISIKRILPPSGDLTRRPGLSSNYFHDQVKEGDILDVKVPSGHFFLETGAVTPVVLMAGGIGVTPIFSMLRHILDSGVRREIWFFYGVRDGSEHLFKAELEQAAREHDFIHLHVCYSQPRSTESEGKDYQHRGRVTGTLLKQVLPSSNFDYYLCGPGPFMESLTTDLKAWGVPEQRVNFEAFGPSSVKKSAPAVRTEAVVSSDVARVSFSRSSKEVAFQNPAMSLLELAEANGISLSSGCRSGNCGSCLTAIKEGEVEYMKEPGFQAEEGTCLTCICRPKGKRLVLDA